MHGTESISPWVARWSHLIAAQSRVLDLACGAGRHTFHFLRRNCYVTGIDIAQDAIESIAFRLLDDERKRCELIVADLENAPWPLSGRRFDVVIVTNYLWRPRLDELLACIDEGGVLIYETFAAGNETVGKPSRPDFLLQPGELLRLCERAQLRVVAYEDGFLEEPPRFVQRIVAVRPRSSSIDPPRHHLQA